MFAWLSTMVTSMSASAEDSDEEWLELLVGRVEYCGNVKNLSKSSESD